MKLKLYRKIISTDILPVISPLKLQRLMKINTEKAGLSVLIQVQVSDIKDVICPFTNGYVVYKSALWPQDKT
jgi:hypothetical protein